MDDIRAGRASLRQAEQELELLELGDDVRGVLSLRRQRPLPLSLVSGRLKVDHGTGRGLARAQRQPSTGGRERARGGDVDG